MMQGEDPVRVIGRFIETWDDPVVEREIFGTGEPAAIAALVDRFCRNHLGAGVRAYVFYASVGSTHGIELEDGRRVVLKARPPAEANPDLVLDARALASVDDAMRFLADQGYPCARPLLGPQAIGNGLATIESMLEHGAHGDGFDPACRRVIAAGLAELVDRLRALPGDFTHLRHLRAGKNLYPRPHSRIFDFERTADGAEWIDAFARRARALGPPPDPPLLGHCDWRVEHLRFTGDRIVAVFDWDSLAWRAETEILGISAHGFTADWSREGVRRIPGADDIRSYVAAYERARGRAFTRDERRAVFATIVYTIAYGARCAHSLHPATRDWAPDSWPHLLRNEGETLLRET
jgi:hypothetical protein